jgi:hypothetical protein
MGDYNISCFISGLSIGYGDEYYIIPLYANDDYKLTDTPDRQYDLFIPATFPILCKYDNCGRGDVVRNDHVSFLEKRFKADIIDIVDDNSRLFFDNFCYVHKGIFDALQEYRRSYDGKKEQMYNFEKELDKYIQFYRHCIENHVLSIKVFKKYIGTDVHAAEYVKEKITEIKTLKFGYNSNSDCIALTFRHMTELEQLYLTRIIKGDFKDELLSFIKFNMHMFSIGKQYIPSIYGEQYGNHYLANAVLNATKKITSKKIKRDKDNRSRW